MRTLVAVLLVILLGLLAACGTSAVGSTVATPGANASDLPLAADVQATPAAASGLISTGDGSWVWQWPLPQGNLLHDVTFADGGAGWAVGDGGTLLTTVDGGVTWASRDAGTRSGLSAIDFVDAKNGWAVGDDGVVVRTTDGGTTWTVSTVAVDDLLDVSFVNATTGWALGMFVDPQSASPYSGVLFRTTDGGVTWTTQKTWTAAKLNAVGFADDKEGWVVGDGARIEHTSDGGATWTTQKVDTELTLHNLCVVDAATVWAAGEIVLKTSDGGTTWESRSNLDIAGDTFSGIAVAADGRVVAAGWFYPDEVENNGCGVIAASADGGATWKNDFEADYLDGAFTAASFRSPSAVCVVGAGGSVMRSNDGGATWTGREPRDRHQLEAIDFVDARTGWAVGSWFGPDDLSSLVLRTTDGGSTWKESIFEKGYYGSGLTGVDFVNARTGYAVGEAGLVLRSTDGGAGWRVVHASRTGGGALSAVDAVSATRAWAVGERGSILTTRDGVRWTKQRSRVVDGLYGVAFPSATVGYAVGENGCILKTADGGATWRRAAPAGETWFRAVDFVDPAHGWAVGAAQADGDASVPVPVVLVTADGGKTWKPQTPAGSVSPLAVDFVDLQTGWVSTAEWTVFATADGGATWTPEDPGAAAPVMGFAAVSPTDVWAATLEAGILRRAAP